MRAGIPVYARPTQANCEFSSLLLLNLYKEVSSLSEIGRNRVCDILIGDEVRDGDGGGLTRGEVVTMDGLEYPAHAA